jgi:transcriptional regulator GlxA family with amidase domain
VKQARTQLLKWHAEGAFIAASCIGTFLLAETGLLDHREATTTRWLAPLFRQRYPNVLLDESRMLVPTDIGVTAGAAMGHLDLALWLIRRSSPALSSLVSRYLLADVRSLQATYIIPNHLAQADPLIQRFEPWAREHLKNGFSLQEAAKALATSPRTLQRRCDAVLGKSPLAYFQDLRVEHAQSLLHGNDFDIEEVAAEVGYAAGATLRTLLRERLGRGVPPGEKARGSVLLGAEAADIAPELKADRKTYSNLKELIRKGVYPDAANFIIAYVAKRCSEVGGTIQAVTLHKR